VIYASPIKRCREHKQGKQNGKLVYSPEEDFAVKERQEARATPDAP
jgi:hypothetical protein